MSKQPLKKSFKTIRFGVVGATGMVGRSILSVLYEHDVRIENIDAIASSRHKSHVMTYGETQDLRVHAVDAYDFSRVDIVFFAIDHSIAHKYIQIATDAGALVIDKSSYYRMDVDVPLVIPEVNPQTLELCAKKRIIANPNCSTIQLVTVLKPLHDINPIKRVVVSTYQAVSGAGSMAMDTLFSETKAVLMNQPMPHETYFPKPIAFNVIPHIDDILDSGDTKEELKMRNETKKILACDIQVAATCVRVPVFIGHALSVNIEFKEPVHLKKCQDVLHKAKGIALAKDCDTYHTPIECAHENDIFVSRMRLDSSVENGLALWIVTDNTRKGAALNGVQIVQMICKSHSHLLRS